MDPASLLIEFRVIAKKQPILTKKIIITKRLCAENCRNITQTGALKIKVEYNRTKIGRKNLVSIEPGMIAIAGKMNIIRHVIHSRVGE
ncbi:MAG: hypothetical protein EOO43_24485 [Flavobacterium sp.]|nr:MAG: hypothetical protein EOO43_24485 [Flavobacterium sp.]